MSDEMPSSVEKPSLDQRIGLISEVEKKVGEMMRNIQSCVAELAKEKQISKAKMEETSKGFRESLDFVDKTLSAQLDYLQNVCVGSAHQGSTFASQQNVMIADQCQNYMHSELARITKEHFPRQVKGDDAMDTL